MTMAELERFLKENLVVRKHGAIAGWRFILWRFRDGSAIGTSFPINPDYDGDWITDYVY